METHTGGEFTVYTPQPTAFQPRPLADAAFHGARPGERPWIPRTDRLIGVVDTALVVAAIGASAIVGAVAPEGGPREVMLPVGAFISMLGIAVVWSWLLSLRQAGSAPLVAAPRGDAFVAGCIAVLAWMLLLAVGWVWGLPGLTSRVVLAGTVATVVVSTATRMVASTIAARAARRSPRRVVIVGTGPRAQRLFRQVRESAHGYRVVGFVDDQCCAPDANIRARMLGGVDDLDRILMLHVVEEVLVALPVKSHYSVIQRALRSSEQVGVPASYTADLFEYDYTRPRYGSARPFPAVSSSTLDEDDIRLVLKRGLDVVGASVALVALSPLFLFIAIAIRLTSPGSAIFVQERCGLHRRRFRMLKFRTMVVDAEARLREIEHLNEATGPAFKIRGDPRLTPLGRFLRKWSLDELPQFWNVLVGDMSLVGPRPMSVRDVALFDEPWFMRRFSVRPGLTCLWQVSGRSNLTFDDWIALDLAYIDSWSLGLDASILARTLPAVMRATGAM